MVLASYLCNPRVIIFLANAFLKFVYAFNRTPTLGLDIIYVCLANSTGFDNYVRKAPDTTAVTFNRRRIR